MIALLEARQAGLWGRAHWARNLVAGLIVGVVALPLALAFAIASGVKPEHGLYTAIVASLAVSLFGGTRLQIAGPTGAFVVILAGVTAKYGFAGLQVATLMAGCILLALGLARLGTVIKYIPYPVITGFTSGIALIIFIGQWRDFFGLHPVAGGEHFHEKLQQLILAFPGLHLTTTALACFSLAVLLISPRIFKRIPAPLVAMSLATALQAFFDFDGVATIGSAFGGIPQSLPSFSPPDLSFADIMRLVGPAFTIALLGAIESLLSAVVADGMAGTRHDPNQELIGQGVANVLAPLFGGFAATGAIARTATGIRNGATSPLTGITHALTLVLIIVLLAPLATYIPLCALAAILFVVAWNMSELPHFLRLLRTAPRSDVLILLITFGLTVFGDLVIAVNVGVILSSLLFMRRMAQSVEVVEHPLADEAGDSKQLPPGVVVYRIDGPFFFGAVEKLEGILQSIQSRMQVLVLHLGNVPFIDATGLRVLTELQNNCRKRGTRLILTEMRANVFGKLQRTGLIAEVGADNVFERVDDCLARLAES
ncbi:putative sulfate transporter YvdB [Sterolibacterium denitrificans]|uniref:Sulfate transporter n=2 Tax=Sterolibacterium denitrificans TaxID=157592 RepID=A0A656ZCV4_9PROT|nr:SulP family inorganic anion transporter [Sterolibacterium denitrificans]KYC29491.1 sulfate transporter [Sterolibacterium denitrificans]SMB31953.1 putative sulfate transporter YvdB [Sterolibacterium denitrificans]